MKHLSPILFAFILFVVSSLNLRAQDFIGFNTNPYAGVTAIDLQPASIVGTVYRADINIAGGGYFLYNNYLKFKSKIPLKWSFREPNAIEFDTAGVNTNIYAHTRVQLPSFMLDIDNNSAFAFTMQVRNGFYAENIPKELAKLHRESFAYAPYHGNSYQAPDVDILSLTWTEVGATYGRLFFSNEHRFKIAGRLKWIAGTSAFYLRSNYMDYEFLNDSMVNVSASFGYGHSSETNALKMNMQAHSFALDFGVKYSYMNRIVLGASLLDFGRLKFTPPPDVSFFIMSRNNWNVAAESIESVADFDDIGYWNLSDYGDDFTVGLPTAISFQATAYLWESGVFEGGGYQNFYLNVSTYHALKLNRFDRQVNAINTYTITPGFNSISIAAGFPFTINSLGSKTFGAFIRLGPFVAGSKNFFSNIFKKHINNSDVYMALKVPLIKAKPKIVNGCAKRF